MTLKEKKLKKGVLRDVNVCTGLGKTGGKKLVTKQQLSYFSKALKKIPVVSDRIKKKK